MVKKINIKNYIKNNYEFLLSFLLLFLILIVAINPKSYISATLKGFTIWAQIVLPSLFCFFIFTKLLMQNNSTIKIFNFLNKPFEKLFNTPKVGGYIFFMSAISGYPVGAKLISEFYQSGTITRDEAFRLSCYASTSGPMFVVGSVGVAMFSNVNLGVIVLISHLLSALINGLLYRNFTFEENKRQKLRLNNSLYKKFSRNKSEKTKLKNDNITITNTKNINTLQNKENLNSQKQSLNDIMYNTIVSVMMIGGYIALCFTILEVLNCLNILNGLGYIINKLFPRDAQIGESILKGILELTNGCVSISAGNYNLRIVCIALSFLTSFGGFSIHLQSYLFLSKCNISYKHFFFSKILHSTITIIISLVFSFILL